MEQNGTERNGNPEVAFSNHRAIYICIALCFKSMAYIVSPKKEK
jgi:hypothetical protein